MKLITWNFQGVFIKKAETILLQQPNIFVVQEWEHPDKLFFNSTTQLPNDFLWFSENKNKGLGVFSYSDDSLKYYHKAAILFNCHFYNEAEKTLI